MKKRMVILGILTLLTLWALACERVAREPLSEEMEQQIAMLPQNANMLGYLNFKEIRQSQLYELLSDSIRIHKFYEDDDYQEFIKSTDFDFQKDIDEIYLAGQFSGHEDSTVGLIVALGNYNPEKIMQYVQSKDDDNEISKESYHEFEVYHLEEDNDALKAFCFVDSKTFIAGHHTAVKNWLDQSIQAKQPKIDPTLRTRIEPLRYKKHAWFSISTQSFLNELEHFDELRKLQGLKSIKNMNLSFRITEQLDFYGELECTDTEKAELFQDAIKGAISTAKLSISEDRKSVDILNKIDVALRRNSVEIKFNMTKTDLERLLENRYKVKSGIV